MLDLAEMQAWQGVDRNAPAAWLVRSGLLHTFRIAVGLLLFCAAVLKAWQFTHSLVRPAGLEGLTGFIPALIGWEMFLGLVLISGVFGNAVCWAAIACFSLFGCYALYEAVSGYASCGCFGQVPVNPWCTAALDAAVVLGLVFLARPAGQRPKAGKARAPWRRLQVVAIVAGAAIGLAVGIAAAELHPRPRTVVPGVSFFNGGKLVLLEPTQWIGHRFPLLKYIATPEGRPSVGAAFAHGSWVMLLYHADCDECRQAIPVYEAFATQVGASPTALRVALIRVPEDLPAPAPTAPFGVNAALRASLDSSHAWFVETPAALEIRRGGVIAAASGSAAMGLGWLQAREPTRGDVRSVRKP